MARPNRQRAIGSERALARRIQWERENRGWSYDGLASRMTQVGCPIQPSALYKVEKADPPRRITVDELVALARVMELDINELLRPLEEVLFSELAGLFEAEDAAWENFREAVDRVVDTQVAVREVYAEAAEDSDLRRAIEAWNERRFPKAAPAKKSPGGLGRVVAKVEAERATWTDEQWARNEQDLRIDDAVSSLQAVLEDVANERAGISRG